MYDAAFYDLIRPGVQSSAAAVVPVVISHLHPMRVIDVGCGEGWWAMEFARHGCEVVGVDDGKIPQSPLGDRFVRHNLVYPLPDLKAFDLAVCLEVAEHLPAARGDSLIGELLRLAPTVLFSAAIPGQGGVGHINEQWPGYWVERFAIHGATCSGALRWIIWEYRSVENWYRQNLLVASREPERYPEIFATVLATPWAVVHPVLYDARRQP